MQSFKTSRRVPGALSAQQAPVEALNNSVYIPKSTKAFAYLRVSGQSQVAGDGFTRQRAAIEEYALANGIEVVDWFEERGVSGKTDWEHRPAWLAMIAAILSNGVRTVIIERLDRLARDVGVQEHIMRDLKTRKVEIISTTEPDLGSSDPTRVLFRQIMAAISQFDRAMLTAKMSAAKKRIRDSGQRCDGRKPFGWWEMESAALEKMRELRATGMGFDAIAADLNAAGVPTRTGRPWHGVVVNRILSRG